MDWSGLDGGSSRESQMDAPGGFVLEGKQMLFGQAFLRAIGGRVVALPRVSSHLRRVSGLDEISGSLFGRPSLSSCRHCCQLYVLRNRSSDWNPKPNAGADPSPKPSSIPGLCYVLIPE